MKPAPLLLAAVLSSNALNAQTTPPPDLPPPSKELIGDYLSGDRIVYVTEVHGRLRVRTSPFASRPLPVGAVQGNELWLHGQRFLKRDIAQGTFRITPV